MRNERATRIGLITSSALPRLNADDALLLRPLAERGLEATAAVWSDPDVAWEGFDLAVIRTPWDYLARFEAFSAWLARLDAARVPLESPVEVVRWNIDKRYLLELAELGAPSVPTRVIPAGCTAADIRAACDFAGERFVCKPRLGAGAHGFLTAARGDEDRLAAALAGDAFHRHGTLVQPLLPAILEDGEWSLVYLDGRFSHAVRKRGKAGDLRVQEEHGGTTGPAAPPADVRAAAETVLRVLAAWKPSWTPLYARVDLVRFEGVPCLMELELVEPHLFLAHGAGAPERFADAIARRVAAARERRLTAAGAPS